MVGIRARNACRATLRQQSVASYTDRLGGQGLPSFAALTQATQALAALVSSFAILRLKKRQTKAAGAMARHALREDTVTNADPAKAAANRVLVGAGKTADQVMAGIKAALPEKRRKDAVEVVEFLVTASPEAMRAKSEKAQDAYFAAALRWLASKFGGKANVHLAVVHRDESTPHMQVLMTPLVEGKLQGNKLIGGPAGLRAHQTAFAAEVGAKHGLVRGLELKPGEERPRYQSIRRWYAAIAAAGGVHKLPQAMAVPALPPVPEAPGVFASSATRREHKEALEARERALEARKRAQEHNRARQQQIEALARVGVATYGQEARGIGERLAKAAEAEERTRQAAELLAKQRAEFNALHADLAKVTDQVERTREALGSGVLLREREQLQAEVDELRAQVRQR